MFRYPQAVLPISMHLEGGRVLETEELRKVLETDLISDPGKMLCAGLLTGLTSVNF